MIAALLVLKNTADVVVDHHLVTTAFGRVFYLSCFTFWASCSLVLAACERCTNAMILCMLLITCSQHAGTPNDRQVEDVEDGHRYVKR